MAKQKEKFKTRHAVFDEFTNRNLYKLITEGHFEGVESPISVGKESNVFTGKKGDDRIIIKIYRLETCDFNRMYDYIKHDQRYMGLKKKRRKIIFCWTQREYRNLLLARQAGVKVPTPITFHDNILIMEYIGDEGPAPKLKDKEPKNVAEFAKDVLENMKKLHDVNMVHGDLSQFNILNHNERAVFIDFSQSTTRDDPRFMEFLKRDSFNIYEYFKKKKYNLKDQINKLFKITLITEDE